MYEFLEDEKRFYIITEICKGGELFDEILERIENKDESKKFTEKEIGLIMKQLLSAVNYCHQKGVVHRDLKPENVLLEPSKDFEQLKVVDFGTSLAYHPTEGQMSEKLGTAYYIAPEVIKQKVTPLLNAHSTTKNATSGASASCSTSCSWASRHSTARATTPSWRRSRSASTRTPVSSARFLTPAGDKWDKLSPQAREFVQLLLTYNPKERPSAADCLQHAFITEVGSGKLQIESAAGAFESIASFKADQKLKRAAYAYIASQVISKSEKEDLSKIFKALDKNGDGQLSRTEIMDGFENIYGRHVDEDELDQMFKQIDLDGSGTIEYTEFIAASMSQKQISSKEKMTAAFKLFDKDNSGTITAAEIKEVLGAGKGGITEAAISGSLEWK